MSDELRAITLHEISRTAPGPTAAILGNGPSLHLAELVPVDVVIGVNRAWQSPHPLDWWLTLDTEHWCRAQQERPEQLADCGWAIATDRLVEHPPTWTPSPLLPWEIRKGSPIGTSPDVGTLATQDGGSSITPAIHLGLILGCRRIVLYGVDLARSRGADHFTDLQGEDAPPDAGSYTKTRTVFVPMREWLERFAAGWGSVLELVCMSPVARLRGWENPMAEAEGGVDG